MGIRILQNPGIGGPEKWGGNAHLHFSLRNRGLLKATFESYIIAIVYFVKAYFDSMPGRCLTERRLVFTLIQFMISSRPVTNRKRRMTAGNKTIRALGLCSGGLDSILAALVLREQGIEVLSGF